MAFDAAVFLLLDPEPEPKPESRETMVPLVAEDRVKAEEARDLKSDVEEGEM